MVEKNDFLKSAIKGWPGAEVYFRTDWGCEYFHVLGKCFAMLGKENNQEPIITIKGLPEKNEELRAMYSYVIPGYYANKTHWNSVLLNQSTFSEEELVQLLRISYELVFAKLPRKLRESL